MKFYGWKLFHKEQAGWTLIEVMAAVAITGIISLGASVSSAQIMNQTSNDRNHALANTYVTNAINWISRDALMAQTLSGYDIFPDDKLSLSWVQWDNKVCSANYSVVNGELQRTYSDGTNVSTTFIAQYINTDENMTCCTSGSGTLTVTITCSVGQGSCIVNVTKTRTITCRPEL